MLNRQFKASAIGCLLVAGAMFITSCSNKITEEQLKKLSDLRAQDKSLTELISKKQSEKSSLDKEIASRKTELGECSKRLDYIKQKLSLWPNVWPDYKIPTEPDNTNKGE